MVDCDQPVNEPIPTSTLTQLKATIETAPRVIENATEARNYLKKGQWILQTQGNTGDHSLLPSGNSQTTDKIPEIPANINKAVVYLIEETTITEYVDKIADRLYKLTTTATNDKDPTSNETTIQPSTR